MPLVFHINMSVFCNFAPEFEKSTMKKTKITPIIKEPSLWALSPLLVFLCLYLVVSLIVNDFYKVPITVAFLVASVYAVRRPAESFFRVTAIVNLAL